jgi:GNAT superfamily N-acetyltransferase
MISLVQACAAAFRKSGEPLGPAYYDACKAIDGYSGDGTYNVVNHRVSKFYDLFFRQYYYEPIRNFTEFLEVDYQNRLLLDGGAPEWAQANVGIGFRAFRSIFHAPQGLLELPAIDEDEVGEHSVAVLGYDKARDSVVFPNSWGETWGDRGLGYMPREYFERYATDVWLVRNARVGPHPEKFEQFLASKDAKEFARIWMIENTRWRRRFRSDGRRLQWVIYETVSVGGQPVEVVELRSGYGLVLGWFHIAHRDGPERTTSTVTEFFVWPAFRREGLGLLLAEAAESVASKWKAHVIEVLIHEADNPAHSAASPIEGFATRLGFELSYSEGDRPSLAATAQKRLIQSYKKADTSL